MITLTLEISKQYKFEWNGSIYLILHLMDKRKPIRIKLTK